MLQRKWILNIQVLHISDIHAIRAIFLSISLLYHLLDIEFHYSGLPDWSLHDRLHFEFPSKRQATPEHSQFIPF